MYAPRRDFRRALFSASVPWLLLPLLFVGGVAGCRGSDAVAAGARARGAGGEGGPVPGRAARDLGRTYTTWLEKGDHARLWQRFGPDMRRAFGTPDSLRTYLAGTLAALGTERGEPRESLELSDTVLVYTRVASFEKAAQPMMLQWTLGRRGVITGFFLRPEPRDSAHADAEQTAGAPVPAGAATPVKPGVAR